MDKQEATDYIARRVRVKLAEIRPRVTQAQIAEMLGIRQQYVSARLNGRTHFSAFELARVASFLGCDVNDLLPPPQSLGDVVTVTRQSHLLHMAPVVSIRAGLDRRHSRTGFIPSQQSA